VLPMTWQRSVIACLVLSFAAGFITAGIEFAWYGIATGISPWRVFAANETLRFGLRPAHYVVLTGFAATVLVGLRRVADMPRPRPVLTQASVE